MIIHVSFNRLSAPETKLLIYIYTVYINQNNETQLQPSSFSGYEWILFLHVAFGPFRTSKFPGSRTSTLYALPVKRWNPKAISESERIMAYLCNLCQNLFRFVGCFMLFPHDPHFSCWIPGFFLEQNGTCRSSVQCFTPFGTSTLRAPMATKPPPDTTCESASCEVGKSWEIPGNPEVCWENHRIKRTFYIAMFDYQREKPVGSWASPEKYARHWGSSF